MQKSINLEAFTYSLPHDRIAVYPIEPRDHSKLLVYKSGAITHDHFFNLTDHLPPSSLLIFNNTKVIPARLFFPKDTGAVIEIFLLHPVEPSPLLVMAMQSTRSCTWKCTIGNLKRWPSGMPLHKTSRLVTLTATLVNAAEGTVQFSWNEGYTFAEVISELGETPLPPYLKRKAEPSDQERYQTIYSKYKGAVAAPTAGLHFTQNVFGKLKERSIEQEFITLHVSAGTFQPIKTQDASQHVMHQEQLVVGRSTIRNLLLTRAPIIPVGTTSMRTLESLYWFGAKLLQQPDATFMISQYDPYELAAPSKEEALQAVLYYLEKNGWETLIGETAIYITPGYTFRLCHGLITNFHQPASTLILLVAALVGDDWKKIYNEALQHDYRFLSFGDSSLLMPSR
jgi:S-adenosylmethionine:tRNA ribosyltransferase-isomerase